METVKTDYIPVQTGQTIITIELDKPVKQLYLTMFNKEIRLRTIFKKPNQYEANLADWPNFLTTNTGITINGICEHKVYKITGKISVVVNDETITAFTFKSNVNKDLGFRAIFRSIVSPSDGIATKMKFNRVDYAVKGNSSMEDEGGEVTIFYGTNRKQTGNYEPNKFYGNKMSDELELGNCIISIPPNHKKGDMERPLFIWGVSLSGEDTVKHVVLSDVKPILYEEFYQQFQDPSKAHIPQSKTALVFIHGYRTSFAEAARRTGQLAYDLPYNGHVGFFCWPSKARLLSYGADIEIADSSIQPFKKFITDLITIGGIEEIQFIAHSMGNRILTSALREFQLERKNTLLSRFSEIVLAAPDIDKEVFEKQLLPEFSKVGSRRTLYASGKDKALKKSKEMLRDGRRRLGDSGKGIFTSPSLDSIDASNVEADDDHSYMFEEKEVLTDLYQLLVNGQSPLQRGLRGRSCAKGNPYWILSK